MNKLKVPAAQDIARIIAPTDAETEQRLYNYYTDPSGGFFSYRIAQSFCRYAFGHTLPLERILEGCEREHTPEGRAQNTDVLKLLWNLSAKRSVVTFSLKPKILAIRKDLAIRVAPPFYFVEHDKPYVYWLQPRKGYALSFAELGLLASIVKATFLVDDMVDVGFEVCDLSAPSGKKREPRTYHLESFNIIPEGEVYEGLQRFARSFDSLRTKGIEQKKRPQKQPPKGPDLFDGGK